MYKFDKREDTDIQRKGFFKMLRTAYIKNIKPSLFFFELLK